MTTTTLIVASIIAFHTPKEIPLTTAIRIAVCESRFDLLAKNPHSTAKGVYQWTDPTWKYIKAPSNQYDAHENIKQFMKWYPIHPEWWSECNKKVL